MFVIAGLGNPGNQYECTRHNIGFEAVDYIADVYHIPINRLGFKALYGQGMIQGEKVVLLKPQTFMNLSGQSVKAALDFYKLSPERLIVLYDDVSLDVGRLRIRPSGSAGGHNGIKNIIYMLNTDVFPRIKIGVGGKANPNMDLAAHVLGRFSKEEIEVLEEVIKKAEYAVPIMMKQGTSAAMNKCNGA